MTKPRTALRLLWLALAVAAWLTCFVMLVRFGTWFVFALAGTVLVALAFRFDPALLDLLRPSLAKVAIGFLLGAMMILLTHAALSLVTARWPEARTATFRLYTLLNAGGLPPSARAALVVVIATCEEILFRCVLTGSDPLADRNGLQHLLTWRSLGRVVVLAACYAAATLPLGSFALAVCALLCGIAWGGLCVATRSLVPAIVAHVLWDLGVLFAWPLI